MWHVFADVKTAEDLNLPVPDIARRPSDGNRDGRDRRPAAATESSDLDRPIGRARPRSSAAAVEPDEDNMLLITPTAAKPHSTSVSSTRRVREHRPTKLDAVGIAASGSLGIHHDTEDNQYLDGTGNLSPARGRCSWCSATWSTPNERRWDGTTSSRRQLIRPRGARRRRPLHP